MNILDRINCQKTDIVVYETKDFDKLTFVKTNRNIDEAHVEEIKDSIREKGYLKNPIIIDSEGKVKEGQHRYMACKELNHPIYFIVDDDITMSDIITMNSTHKNWSMLTYVESMANDGIESYQYLLALYKRFHTVYQKSSIFNLDHISMALFNKATVPDHKRTKNGLLSITKQMYDNAYTKLEWVENIFNYYRTENLKFKGNLSSMVSALIWCYGYIKLPNDKLADLIIYDFQDTQDWSSIESCLNEINRKYKRRYGPKNWKDLLSAYNTDPKRKVPAPFYDRRDQQPMKGDTDVKFRNY